MIDNHCETHERLQWPNLLSSCGPVCACNRPVPYMAANTAAPAPDGYSAKQSATILLDVGFC